jgi:hypothetical protein
VGSNPIPDVRSDLRKDVSGRRLKKGDRCSYMMIEVGVCSEGSIVLRDVSGEVDVDIDRRGKFLCSPPKYYNKNEFTCDEQDNDCDGEIDENCDTGT